MALASVDALGAFTFLLDNLPSWIDRVSELSVYTATKHAEYSAAFQKLSHSRPRRRKNSSICSIRTDDDHSTQHITPYAGLPQKRGNEEVSSVCSSVSGLVDGALVSLRHNVVIHYDGHTQKTLEELVRYVGTARNHLRRGKISQLTRPGLRMTTTIRARQPTLPAAAGPAADDDVADHAITMTCVRSTRTRAVQKESAFDFAEKQLELIHTLCEVAAHQLLRYGHCASELDSVEEKLKLLLEMATNEVGRLREERKKDQEAAVAAAAAPAPAAETAAATTAVPAKASDPCPTTNSTVTTKPASSVTFGLKPASPNIQAIEVDDRSSASSLHSIDLTAFRATRRLRQ